jgi:hypothetical protein
MINARSLGDLLRSRRAGFQRKRSHDFSELLVAEDLGRHKS